ncbi:MAG: D-alanyl-D-alanine carboxypeptidase family protein [Actinomycetota bacterium]
MRRTIVPVVTAFLAGLVPAGTAAGQSVPPPTPVPPSGSPSPFPTALETPEPSRQPPELAAGSAALVDLDSGQLLFQHNARERRPIASTTKIVTALLVLEAVRPGDRVTATPNAASQTGAMLGLEAGERISVRDLLQALLLSSANDAAVALAEHVAGSVDAFLERMNDRMHQLGARDSRFESPNGLDDDGYSTAGDLARLTVEAYRNPTFADVVAAKAAEIPAPTGPPRVLQNRNALLWLYPDAIGVKTGFTSAAGHCLVSAAERDGMRLAAVVLGSPVEAFSDSAALLNYGFETFERRTVVERGQSFGSIAVEDREVDVVADVPLEVLLRRGRDTHAEVRPRPGLSLPLAAGQRVGTAVISAGRQVLGEVPLVTTNAVSVPPVPERPWWEKAWDGVAGFFVGLFRAVFG